MRYRVHLEQDEDGLWVSSCPSLPGCISEGHSRTQALANIREAIQLHLESLQEHGEAIPPGVDEEIVEVGGQ